MLKKFIFIFFVLISAGYSQEIKLKSIVYIDDYKNFSGNAKTDGINFIGFNPPDKTELIRRTKPFLGKAISLELIDEIKKKTLLFYRDEGFFVVDVSALANQDITDGSLKILVTVGKTGNVKVEGNKYFSKQQYLKGFDLRKGDQVNENQVVKDLYWLNLSPYRNVDIIYEKGKEIGYTDITLKANDIKPMKVIAGYDHSKYQIAGSNRFTLGFNLGNLFYNSHQLNFQLMGSPEIGRWAGLNGSYIIPLPWKNSLKVYGCYVRSKPEEKPINLSEGDNLIGKFWQISPRYNFYFKTYSTYYQTLQLGYDFKRTNNFLEIIDGVVSLNKIDISQFLIRYEGEKKFKKGGIFFGASMYISPGSMTDNNKTRNFDVTRPGAKSEYYYFTFNFDSIWRFSEYLFWAFSSYIQTTTSKLLPIEELSLGGMYTVRGYPENEIISDRGFYMRNELRLKEMSFYNKKSNIQFLGFIDYGYGNDVDQNILDKNNAHLLSIGPGLRYNLKELLTVKFDYGFQLKEIYGRLFGKNIDSEAHLSVYWEF
jgi:hemolysin activation/secretion protein